MKKNFFKKLASGLALAMVVTSFAPAAPAFAAAATKIVEQGGKKAPQTVYVGKKVDYSLNNVYKTNTYKWFTSNAKIAKITQTGGIVTPVAPGKATIKVNAYKKSTGKLIKAFKLDLDVKLRATSVNIGAEDFELAVGEKKDLDAVKTPANSTDTLRYFSSNEKVATVDTKTGIVTAVAAGEATIKVASKGAWFTANNSKYNKYDEVKVTVVDGLLKVNQTKAAELKLTFSKDAADVKATDIAIVNNETNLVYPVKSVKADGKELTVTTYSKMVDGKVYTVTHGDKKLEFTATNNVVASLAISPATVAFNTATTMKVATVDSKGVILDEYKYGEVTDYKLQFDIETTKGYTAGTELVLYEKGDTAKATATYHTYEYDTNGLEVGAIKTELTITAVDKAAVNVKEYKYTIATETPDWKNLKANTRVAIDDTELNTLFLYVLRNDSDVNVADQYTLTSSHSDILIVNDNGNGSATVTAVAQGTAYVLVKDKDGNVVFSLPVSIVAKREAGSLALGETTISLSNAAAAHDNKTVTVTVKDQYGDEMKSATTEDKINVTAVGVPAGVNASTVANKEHVKVSDGKITFIGAAFSKDELGSYNYNITVGKFTRSIRVTVATPDTDKEPKYSLVYNNKPLDVVFDENVKEDKTIEIKVAAIQGPAVAEYAKVKDFVLKKDNKTVTGSAIAVSGTSVVFTGLHLNGKQVEKAATGTYTFVITVENNKGKDIEFKGSFVITDSQPGLSAVLENQYVNTTDVIGAVNDAFNFYYAGKKLAAGDYTVTKVVTSPDVEYFKSGYTYSIKSVTLNVEIGDGYQVPVTVSVGRSITVK
ncbi:Ig-like domain-containing protein [Anaerocolumna aminovalerica]|uniref:Ig-like domain-containing protein n=1 Tax=Anaerocolumna aminovalerica TaxID=1527 RepID=UPI001C0ECEAE|nr:Ig-like domain-containing protein [Anaerocolumna aminovalerica]MBU5332356.1 Ig-like domain-containing protein [Anaerocolumna aminovalerica]